MKLNKKQKEAIKYLKLDLDELSNKPRRLFNSFRMFAEAFEDEEMLPRVIADINEWEEMYYLNISYPRMLQDVAYTAQEVRKDSLREQFDSYSEEEANAYEKGVTVALKKMTSKLSEIIIDDLMF